MELIFIRHGKTQGNRSGRYVGRTDEPILPESREEISSRKMQNEYPPADIVFTSPMLRCIETAHIIYPNQKLIVIPEFRECDFGEFEMKSYEELNGRKDYQAWIDGGGKDPFPGGESMDTVRRRSMRGFYRAMEMAFRESDFTTESPDGAFGLMADSMVSGADPVRENISRGSACMTERSFTGTASAIFPDDVPGGFPGTAPVMGPADSVAFVVHGGTIMSILSVIGGGEFYDFQIENGKCVTFCIEPSLM